MQSNNTSDAQVLLSQTPTKAVNARRIEEDEQRERQQMTLRSGSKASSTNKENRIVGLQI
jgi:hypothetical protein